MKNRPVYECNLEDAVAESPFETYPLFRDSPPSHQLFGHKQRGASIRRVGLFKGVIRVVKSANEKPLFDLSALLSPVTYLVRVYCLEAAGLQPVSGRHCDSYMKVRLLACVRVSSPSPRNDPWPCVRVDFRWQAPHQRQSHGAQEHQRPWAV